MTIENENVSNAEKSAEQLASENNLNLAIQDEAAEHGGAGEQGAQASSGQGAQAALNGLLTVVPMGLNVVGLKNTAAVWSGEVIDGVSGALLPVLKKYAFGQRFLAYLESGGGVEEFALLIALSPVAVATYNAYQLDSKPKEKTVQGETVKGEEVKAEQADGVHSVDSPLGSTFKFKV